MKTIFITGFPHSGTSIIRRIVGAHPDVAETCRETLPKNFKFTDLANLSETDPLWAVMKAAVVRKDIVPELQEMGDVRIFVIRNPLDSFASLKLRDSKGVFNFEEHVDLWHTWAEFWRKEAGKEPPGRFPWKARRDHTIPIRYEDLFKRDPAEQIEHLIRLCGLPKCPDIQQRMADNPVPINYDTVPSKEPARTKHEAFRSWQINQPLENLNDRNRAALLTEETSLLLRLPSFRKIYQ